MMQVDRLWRFQSSMMAPGVPSSLSNTSVPPLDAPFGDLDNIFTFKHVNSQQAQHADHGRLHSSNSGSGNGNTINNNNNNTILHRGVKRPRPTGYNSSPPPLCLPASQVPLAAPLNPASCTASPDVNAFAPSLLRPLPHYPTAFQQSIPSLPSAPSYSSLSDSSAFSAYASAPALDHSNDRVSLTPQSAVSHTPERDDTQLTQMPHFPMPSAGVDTSGTFSSPMTPQQYFPPADKSYTSTPASLPQNPYSNPVVNYSGKTPDWPDTQWVVQQQGPAQAPTNMYQDTAELYGKDASLHVKLQSLTVLDNLATQIILTLAKLTLPEIEKLTSGPDDEEKQAYVTRKALFDHTRKVYSRDSPFIDAVAIQPFTPSQQEIIRKANRATFISSLLESHAISFFDLNEYFLEVFVPTGQRLLKWHGAIFLELKTQVYISALLNSGGEVGTLLEELFPADMEERIIARHPDAPHLVPSEQDFVERVRSRKQYLQAEPAKTALQTLPRRYVWQEFLREFAASISKNVESLLNPSNRSNANYLTLSHGAPDPLRRNLGSGLEIGTEGQQQSGVAEAGGESCNPPRGDYTSFGALVPEPNMYAGMTIPADILTGHSGGNNKKRSLSSESGITPAKTTASTRQPWKQEEEDALLTGLAEVKGPYWSRILSMYGRGGSRSEVLKDRNQIQLKDKARNLKLWYLKMGNEVPLCLQGVTGELRKRGGAKVRAQLEMERGLRKQ